MKHGLVPMTTGPAERWRYIGEGAANVVVVEKDGGGRALRLAKTSARTAPGEQLCPAELGPSVLPALVWAVTVRSSTPCSLLGHFAGILGNCYGVCVVLAGFEQPLRTTPTRQGHGEKGFSRPTNHSFSERSCFDLQLTGEVMTLT